jgi:hypothetical protein
LLRTIRRSETRPDSVRKLTPPFGYFFRDPRGGRSVTGGNDLTRGRERASRQTEGPAQVGLDRPSTPLYDARSEQAAGRAPGQSVFATADRRPQRRAAALRFADDHRPRGRPWRQERDLADGAPARLGGRHLMGDRGTPALPAFPGSLGRSDPSYVRFQDLCHGGS